MAIGVRGIREKIERDRQRRKARRTQDERDRAIAEGTTGTTFGPRQRQPEPQPGIAGSLFGINQARAAGTPEAIPGVTPIQQGPTQTGQLGVLDEQQAKEAQTGALEQRNFAAGADELTRINEDIQGFFAEEQTPEEVAAGLDPAIAGLEGAGATAAQDIQQARNVELTPVGVRDADTELAGGTQTFRQDRFQVGEDKGKRAPDGQQLFRSVTDKKGNIIGEVFANPEDFPEGDAGGKTVTQKSLSDQLNVVRGGQAGLRDARLRADADVRSHIAEQIRQAERAGNTSGAEELREQQLKTFDDFERDEADAATAEKFGITTDQAKILRGDFGKQPSQQAVPGASRGRGEAGGSRFVFKGQGGSQVIDSQLGVISGEQAAQVQAQRDAQNVAAQQAVQAQVEANQRNQPKPLTTGERIGIANLQRGVARDEATNVQRDVDNQRKQASEDRKQVLAENPDDPERATQILKFMRSSRGSGVGVSQTQAEALLDSAEEGEAAKIAESGFFADFAEGGISGAFSGLFNLVDKASGQPLSRLFGTTKAYGPPRNASEAVQQLQQVRGAIEAGEGVFGGIEVADLDRTSRAKLMDGLRLLPFFEAEAKKARDAARPKKGGQGVQPVLSGFAVGR